MKLLSMRQYAKHRGVSAEAVSKAVKKGRITCKRDEKGRALIDPEVADREWEANSDPSKFRSSGEDNRAPRPAETPPAEESQGPSVHKSAAILKAYQARLAKLEFDERSGKLLPAEQVERDWFKAGRTTRDAVLSIPARVAAEFAGETDAFTIQTRLENELRQALTHLADETEGVEGGPAE